MAKKAAVSPAAKKVTQKEAVRQALAAGKTDPTEGVAYVKEHFGITLKNNQSFSTLKSQLKAKGVQPSLPEGRAVPAGSGVVGNGKANPADLVRGLRKLIATFGPDVVRDTAAALAE